MNSRSRFARPGRLLLASLVLAGAALTASPSFAFVAVDGAGIETRDTASGGPPTTEFVDVAATCGVACRLTVGDDQIVPIAPPAGQPDWPFHWSSNVATQGVAGGADAQATVWLDSNGYVAFKRPSGPYYLPSAMPAAGGPDAIVAGVWTDLNPGLTSHPGGIYRQLTGTAPNRLLYLQWSNVPEFGGACSSFNFEIVLRESDNSVTVHYRNNPCTTRAATGGQENGTGSAGTTYFNGTAIPDFVSVRYRDVVAPAAAAPVVTCGTPGANGWCRSSTNTVTITDNDDAGAGHAGLGVKSRTWKFGLLGSMGSYANGVGNSVTRSDGTHNATATVTDWADNTSTSPSTPLRIDTVAPSLDASIDPPANAAGWHNGDVTVTWTCSDATSGVVLCPEPATIDGEGSSLAASETITDVAGNSSSLTRNVKIDRTPPVTTATAPSGWSTSNVVTLQASDALSGVAVTKYNVDGLGEQTGTQITLTEGAHDVVFWSEDAAGNVEDPTVIHVNVDRSAPMITHEVSPSPNAAGWNRAPVTVTFTCADEVSYVVLCTPPSSVTADGASQVVSGTATDAAGNSAQDFAVVSVDRVAPSISVARAPAANANGWSNAPVTVTYSCTDALSGVASCPAPELFMEGTGGASSGVAEDAAGNEATATLGGINVDLRAPDVTAVVSPAPNSAGWHRTDVTVQWVCSDGLSGVVACPSSTLVTGSGAGLTVSSGPVFDRAGNVTSKTITLNIDRTAPVLVYEGADPAPNAAGWNRGAVTMTWSCSDPESSTPTPTIVRTVASETPGTSETVTCVNVAGTSTSDTRGPVRVDVTAPSAAVAAPGAAPVLLTLPVSQTAVPGKARGTATDTLSGVASITVTATEVSGGAQRVLPATCVSGCGAAGVAQWELPVRLIGPGLYRLQARATDRAGNEGQDSPSVLVLVVPL